MQDFVTKEEISSATNGQILAQDPRIPSLITGACEGIRRYCGWHVTPEIQETLTLDSHGGIWLKLPTLRVKEITELQIDGTVIPADSYTWSEKGMLRLKKGTFPDDYQCVKVSLKHGFETTTLKQVVTQVIINALASPLGVTREQAGSISVAWSSTAPGVSGGMSFLQRDLEILDSYRLEAF